MYLEVIKKEPSTITHQTPIIFVHGMWHAAWCWEENFLPYFSQNGYVTYALSLRGHGGSEGYERLRWSSINDYVSDLAQVIEQLETPPILVGHSMGGFIVQKYLESYTSPAAVLLASTPPKGVMLVTARAFLRHPLIILKACLTLNIFLIVSTPHLAKEAFFSSHIPEDKMEAYFSKLQDESFRAYLDMLGLNLPQPRNIKSPVLVLGAENDIMISQKEVEATAQAFGVKAKVFTGMAHNMMLETGWQEVADEILSWLKKLEL